MCGVGEGHMERQDLVQPQHLEAPAGRQLRHRDVPVHRNLRTAAVGQVNQENLDDAQALGRRRAGEATSPLIIPQGR